MIKLNTLSLAAALLLASAFPAQAQSDFIKTNGVEMLRKVGVHLNVSFREPRDPDVSKGTTFGPSLGISPGKSNGWKYPIGLTQFSVNLLDARGERFAILQSRAIVAGIGYGWHFGKLSTGASLQAGFAINRLKTQSDLNRAFDVPSGIVSASAKNSPLLKPQLKAEYFITPKFTVRVSADYMMTTPDIAVMTPAGSIDDRWHASNAHANVGFGFYPFRK